MNTPHVTRPPKENQLVSVICNVVIPFLSLTRLTPLLGPKGALVAAVLWPLGYFIWDWLKRRKVSLLSVVGLLGVLLKGIFGLYELDAFWFAIQDMSLQLFLSAVALASIYPFQKPLASALLINEELMDVTLIKATLDEKGHTQAFQRVMIQITALLALFFFLSAGLHYVVVSQTVTERAGTALFNEQLAQLTWKKWVYFTVPTVIYNSGLLFWSVNRLKALTGLPSSRIFRLEPQKDKA